MTLDERIQAISIERPNEGATATAPPKADTLVTLLTQGLQSEDKKILNVSSHTHYDLLLLEFSVLWIIPSPHV